MNTQVQMLADALVYERQRRAMLFGGITTVTELQWMIRGMKAMMGADQIAAAEGIYKELRGRDQCKEMLAEQDGGPRHRCELFHGHPGRHVAVVTLRKDGK